ncbi:putative F-box protein At5g60060 [Quercus robur]|uniref:putative F-box protein At5g60060 n=1 Tax=Quercus robur TaxID=38942 RepID=UPI0021619120|nr:putative F-box protein At5g60060 [Quercus robur]
MVGLLVSQTVSQPVVPTIFVFGDSTADVGTNNYIPECGAKADMLFNGIDYPDAKPTGRFSNGYNTIDFIVQNLGYSESPPPFLSFVHKQQLQNLNESILNVMAVHIGAKLGVWKMGDKKWTNIDDGRESALYDDAVYYKGKFYAVDITGLAISVDSSMKIKKVTHPLPRFGFGHGGQFKYLVKSPNELFLVDKDYDVEREMFEDERVDSDSDSSDFPLYLMVYKLNEEECEWVKVKSLGDLALFVGDDCSFCVSVKDYVGCKANCVYFTEDSFSKGGRDDYPGYDTGLFDLEDGTASPLSAFPG